MTPIMSLLLTALVAVGYWVIGTVEAYFVSPTEPFDIKRALRTLAAGSIVVFLQGFAGLTIDPTTITNYAQFWALLVIAINKVLNVYAVPAATVAATPAAAAVTDTAAAVPATGPTGEANGHVKILGFYGPSAYANPPKPTQTYDINQVPELFFDAVCDKIGKVMFGIWVDGKPMHDYTEFGEDFLAVGDRRAVAFTYPTLQKTPGPHSLLIMQGHNVASGTTWDESVTYTITFTGVFAQE